MGSALLIARVRGPPHPSNARAPRRIIAFLVCSYENSIDDKRWNNACRFRLCKLFQTKALRKEVVLENESQISSSKILLD